MENNKRVLEYNKKRELVKTLERWRGSLVIVDELQDILF